MRQRLDPDASVDQVSQIIGEITAASSEQEAGSAAPPAPVLRLAA